MAQIFPKWTNRLPAIATGGGGFLAIAVVGFFWYYGSPKYTDVGYQPIQPVPYSHKMHVDSLGMDCRYCHTLVETGPHANVPPTQTCMNCHSIVKADSEKLQPVLQSWSTRKPIEWVRVHELPDFVYFDHSAHLNAGVGCASCHGDVAQMEVVTQVEPLSMSWCLACHRNPGPHLRPKEELTNTAWVPPDDIEAHATAMMNMKSVDPPVDCSGCHR
jgi:hypothetical protein